MHQLRRARSLARVVAAWFLLWICAALGSSLLAPSGFELVCSGNSFKLVSEEGEQAGHLSGSLGECPACLPAAAPPPSEQATALVVSAAPFLSAEIVPPHALSLAGAPPPARGPPISS